MKVVETINRKELVEMAEVDPRNAYCLLEVMIHLTKFDDNKYDGQVIAKEDGYRKDGLTVQDMGKRAINNRLAIFGLSIQIRKETAIQCSLFFVQSFPPASIPWYPGIGYGHWSIGYYLHKQSDRMAGRWVGTGRWVGRRITLYTI